MLHVLLRNLLRCSNWINSLWKWNSSLFFKKLSEIVHAKFFIRKILWEMLRKSIVSLWNFSAKSLRQIIHFPLEIAVQGCCDLVHFASTLTTEKIDRALESQSIFIKKGENNSRKVRLHDPVQFFICLNSDSPFHYNKLLKVKVVLNHCSCTSCFIRWRISRCHQLAHLFRPFRCFCLNHKRWNVAPCQGNQDSDWSAKEFRKRNEKKLKSSQLLSLRSSFARNLSELSLRMPVTCFSRTVSHFAELQ